LLKFQKKLWFSSPGPVAVGESQTNLQKVINSRWT